MRERDAGERTGVVDEIPGREVVGAIDDDVVLGDERREEGAEIDVTVTETELAGVYEVVSAD